MDGKTATQHLKNDPKLKHIPVVAMTANVMTHEVENYYEIGFSGFIGKPFVMEDMLKIISDLLSNRADGEA
jgi:CheY-like chemotaxis protein